MISILFTKICNVEMVYIFAEINTNKAKDIYVQLYSNKSLPYIYIYISRR